MSIHTNPGSPLTVLAVALFLAGCGASDTATTTDVAQLIDTDSRIQDPQVQPAGSAGQGDNGQSVDQGAESISDNTPSTGLPVSDTAVDSDVNSNADTSSGDSVVATADTEVGSATAAGAYPDSVCVAPGTTSVSYEAYQRTRVNSPWGMYVPFPASGFGWDGTQLCDLEGSRGLDEIEVLVPYVAQRPDTDGVIANGEWLKAVNASTLNYETQGNDVDNLLLSPVPDYLDGAGYSEWWAMHDGTNLYLRIRVSNDGFSPIVNDSENFWHDDSIELYFDGDNSKGLSYDGINDFQTMLRTDNETLPYISGSSAPGLRIFHRTGDQFVAYDVEVTINLESLGIEIGKPFGFDVQINEDDNGGDRDAKWAWFEQAGFDRSWYEPAAFGTLMLTDCEDRNSCGSYQTLSP